MTTSVCLSCPRKRNENMLAWGERRRVDAKAGSVRVRCKGE